MDSAAKKHMLRLVPYGLYLAGSKRANGTTNVSLVSWFTQTSFDPVLVVLGMHKDSEAYASVCETKVLTINFLEKSQTEILKKFFKHVEVKDGKAGDLEVVFGANGCPRLPALAGAIELELKEKVALGDHVTCIFQVTDAHIHHPEAKAMGHGDAGLHYAG